MKNTTALLISFILTLATLFTGCNLPKEKFYKVDDVNRDWIINGDAGSSFIMNNSSGISESFTMYSKTQEFSEGASGFLFLTTEVSKRESFYQAFSSTYGNTFSLSLSASYPPFGDEFYVSLNGVSFAYDLEYNEISRLNTPFGNKSKTMTDKGYTGYIIIESSVEMYDDLEIAGTTYHGVLHFTLNDFPDQWTEFSVREIFIAKETGLVRYILNNGLSASRSPD